jgi:2-polyprenylphenol 6-hydroxylase
MPNQLATRRILIVTLEQPLPVHPIVIVGAGLVGATLALALLQRLGQVPILLIDTQTPSSPELPAEGYFDHRVVALNLASQAMLAQLGVWPKLTRLCAYEQMQVWDGEGSGSIEFSAREQGEEQLGWIVENDHLLGQLHQLLATYPQLTVRQDSITSLERSGEYWCLEGASGQSLLTPLILAADGARSLLRTLAEIPVRQWSYGQTALVCRVQSELPHQHTAYQRFSHQGPLAFLPLFTSGGQDCSIVWSLQNEVAEQMLALDDSAFCAALEGAFEGRLGRVLHCDERHALPLHQCHATSYSVPGLTLLGDAAHAIHPLAGQGVNLGLADVTALVDELVRAHQRGLPLSHESVQNRYQRARMPHNLAAMAMMETFKRLFGNANPYLGLVRNLGLSLAGQLPGLKQQFMRLASGR